MARKAAEQDHKDAQTLVGWCYYGIGVTQDNKEAVKWWKKAAEQGDKIAQCNLGGLYYVGHGVLQDYKEAVKWYTKAAKQGYIDAQCNLGSCYYNGHGVDQDSQEAVNWWKKAAEQRYAGEEQKNFEVKYFKATESRGAPVMVLEKDGDCLTVRSPAVYSRHVSLSHPQEKILLLSGYVDKDKADFEPYSLELVKKAVEGDKEAQYNLASRYYLGDGVVKDVEQSVKWLTKSANQGYANAQFNLGGYYLLGIGVAKDAEEGVKWLTKSANQGYAMAQSCLGLQYAKGEGVKKDEKEATKWWTKAAEQGDVKAKEALEAIKKSESK